MRQLCLLLCFFLAEPSAAQSPDLDVGPHRIAPGEGPARNHGKLQLLSALRLERPGDENFGGFSGLWVSPDGRRLTAISDKARWYDWELESEPDGSLAGLTLLDSGALMDLEGRRLEGDARVDAESLARLADGSFLVSFERDHRIWRYPQLFVRPEPFPTPAGHAEGANDGLEAIAELADGRLVALSEGLRTPEAEGGDRRGWIFEDEAWRPFAYERTRALAPTGADRLPNGDLVVVERFFSVVGGLHIRIARLAARDLAPGKLVTSEELAAFREPPQDVDNFEGIAAREGPGGQTLIYLISDDNFNTAVQDTLLFVFRLRGE